MQELNCQNSCKVLYNTQRFRAHEESVPIHHTTTQHTKQKKKLGLAFPLANKLNTKHIFLNVLPTYSLIFFFFFVENAEV